MLNVYIFSSSPLSLATRPACILCCLLRGKVLTDAVRGSQSPVKKQICVRIPTFSGYGVTGYTYDYRTIDVYLIKNKDTIGMC